MLGRRLRRLPTAIGLSLEILEGREVCLGGRGRGKASGPPDPAEPARAAWCALARVDPALLGHVPAAACERVTRPEAREDEHAEDENDQDRDRDREIRERGVARRV